MRRTNVDGSLRVFQAAVAAGVSSLVYASSVGTYSPGPKDSLVDETWPREGIPTSSYSRDKAEVERLLDGFERELRIVRLRKALVFQREAATEIRRLFLGPLFPAWLTRPALIRVVPRLARLRFQAVHAKDVGEAYRRAVVGDVRGPFNIAAEPTIDTEELQRLFNAWSIPIPEALARSIVSASWRLHLQPADAGWLDLALETPLLDTTRARNELRWIPRHSATEALLELLEGMRNGIGLATPPLSPKTSGRFRWKEFKTGIGSR
jgi:nucleoside-diphosphate-sugar epimerase